jgi:hypothetical protein
MTDPFVRYTISQGLLETVDVNGVATSLGPAYSGNGECLNDPTKTWVVGHGPIPVGVYYIGPAENRPESVGAFALPLTPDPATVMNGRSGFFIHGDNPALNHTASDGCVVTARAIRECIASYDVLRVVA